MKHNFILDQKKVALNLNAAAKAYGRKKNKGYWLLSVNADAKTVKSNKIDGYLTAILYLAPEKTVEGVNLCPMAQIAGCRETCLYTAGMASIFNRVNEGRVKRTILFRDNRALFMQMLAEDILRFEALCKELRVKPVVRLNGTSDIAWELIPVYDPRIEATYKSLFSMFYNVQFYDYTKIPSRIDAAKSIDNYSLLFSYSGVPSFKKYIKQAYDKGASLAIVYRDKRTVRALVDNKAKVFGLPVIDGDEHDLRFLDTKTQSVIALAAKGKAKKDDTGFVVDHLI